MRLRLEGVGRRYSGAEFLFRDLTFEFPPGEITAIVGPSGSGKSTLLGIVANALRPSEGRVVRSGVGTAQWVFQNPVGVPHRSALDHVVLPLLARGLAREVAEVAAWETLSRFGLDRLAARRFAELSGGEAQRLCLARAVSAAPTVLLVDEPTAQLDRVNARSVAAVLRELADDERIVLIATHDHDLAATADATLDLGRAR